LALYRRDPERLAAALIAARGTGVPVDRDALRDDLAKLIDGYVGRGAGELAVGGLVRALLDVLRRQRLRLPRDLSLLLRTVVLEEGLVEDLDPEFRLVDSLGPYARRSLLAGVTVSAVLERLRDAGSDLVEVVEDLPGDLRRGLSVLEDGGFEVHLRATELEPLMSRAERLGNRIALSVIAAAFINAGPRFFELARRRRDRRGARTRSK